MWATQPDDCFCVLIPFEVILIRPEHTVKHLFWQAFYLAPFAVSKNRQNMRYFTISNKWTHINSRLVSVLLPILGSIFFPLRIARMRIEIMVKGIKLRNCQNQTTSIIMLSHPSILNFMLPRAEELR